MKTQGIQKIGDFSKTDGSGFLLNSTSISLIDVDWKKGVDDIVEEYKKHFGEKLHSVYIRGSVAKGKAIPNISDIDTIAVVDVEKKDVDRSWVQDFSQDFETKYSFITDVEMNIYTLNNLSKSTKLMIQSQSVCVYGTDLSKTIKPFRVGLDTVQHAQGIGLDIDWVKKYLTEENRTDEQIKQKCIWIMKRILRTGCELVMEKSRKYTRDLYPCYEIFSEYYLPKKGEMEEVVTLSVYPTGDKVEVLRVLDNIGSWIKKEVLEVFGEDFTEKE